MPTALHPGPLPLLCYLVLLIAKIFPTHLSASLIHSHTDRALCTMLCPNTSRADLDAAMRLDQPRETGRGLGLAGLQ